MEGPVLVGVRASMERQPPTGEAVKSAGTSNPRHKPDAVGRAWDYFSLIGGAIFSAGAGGSAGCAPCFCASASGRAGSGAGVVGRVPPGFDSAGGEGDGCVACASCGRSALSSVSEIAEI